ncbi:MAG: glycosyltransferase [Gluconacetobacter diazotrophicus]|nr:glycosyltransferase [Gluconacetobacter diazotrophicus]
MLRGRIDEADRTRLRGWALDETHPNRPATLLVTLNGSLLGRLVANRFRPDLRDAGIGDGRHGFELRFETPLSPLVPHLLRITDELDGSELDRSPFLIEPADRLDASALRRLETLLADDLDDPLRLDERLDFLINQVDRLLSRRARSAGDPVRAWRAARTEPAAGPGSIPTPPPAGTTRPLALAIDEVMPDADRDAGSNALLSHLASLRRLGHRVLFAPAERASATPVLLQALARRQIGACAAPHYASVEEALLRHGPELSLVYLHRASTAARYVRLARHHAPRARIVVSVADLQHLRLHRQATHERSEPMLAAARALAVAELRTLAEADAVLTHSRAEASILSRALPPDRPVHRALWSVPARPVSTPFADRAGVALLADYAHAPNRDAARRLVGEIMPLVWEHEPTLPCLLAGSRLPPDLVPAGDPRVVPVGHVPVLSALFERIRLSVAPLAFGAGVKGKLLHSLAAGIPCACSPVAAEGLDLPAPLSGLVADDTHGLARLIIRLHRDPELNARCAAAALAWAGDELSEVRLDAVLADACTLPAPTAGR